MVNFWRELLETNPLFLDTKITGLDMQAEIVELAMVNARGKKF